MDSASTLGDTVVPQKPLLLSEQDIQRVHNIVQRTLPSEYDHEFIADTIILNAWMKDVPVITWDFIRKKCISAWRQKSREQRRNEGAYRSGMTVGAEMISRSAQEGDRRTGVSKREISNRSRAENTERMEQVAAERKMLVEDAVGALNSFERKIVWMRYYDDQTLQEIASRTTLRREQVQRALEVAIYKMRVHITDV